MKIILLAALVLTTNAMAGGNGYHYGGNYRQSEYSYRLTNPESRGLSNNEINQPSYAKRQLARDMDALETCSQLRMYDIESGGSGDVGYGNSYYRYLDRCSAMYQTLDELAEQIMKENSLLTKNREEIKLFVQFKSEIEND